MNKLDMFEDMIHSWVVNGMLPSDILVAFHNAMKDGILLDEAGATWDQSQLNVMYNRLNACIRMTKEIENS